MVFGDFCALKNFISLYLSIGAVSFCNIFNLSFKEKHLIYSCNKRVCIFPSVFHDLMMIHETINFLHN